MRSHLEEPPRQTAPTIVSPTSLPKPQPSVLWRFALPGVCRLISDPNLLAQWLAIHPEANVQRIPPERAC